MAPLPEEETQSVSRPATPEDQITLEIERLLEESKRLVAVALQLSTQAAEMQQTLEQIKGARQNTRHSIN